jgi:hypothetical protein
MPTAATIRSQVEAALADRIPSALTPPARTIRPVTPTGILSVDEVLEGGLPIGTLTELVGGEFGAHQPRAFLPRRANRLRQSVCLDRCLQQPQSRIGCGRRLGSFTAVVGPLRRACWTAFRAFSCKGLCVAREVSCSSSRQEGSSWGRFRPASAQRGQGSCSSITLTTKSRASDCSTGVSSSMRSSSEKADSSGRNK